MTPAQHIREKIFGYRTQQEFADAVGYTQAQISRFENGLAFSAEAQARIQKHAADRGLAWDNNWFFRVPNPAVTANDFMDDDVPREPATDRPAPTQEADAA
jgi:transcriptional regulator with XRE-family HTH domain